MRACGPGALPRTQVNNLREIQALRRLSPHPHVIRLLEVLYDQPTGRLALVFELMVRERRRAAAPASGAAPRLTVLAAARAPVPQDQNIYELIRGRRAHLPEATVRGYAYQLLKALDHMHRGGVFHRDIKPENILVAGDALKLADFGSCRGIYSRQPYTEYISTRWCAGARARGRAGARAAWQRRRAQHPASSAGGPMSQA